MIFISMNLQENIQRIKQVMNIQEQIPESRFAPKLQSKVDTLPSISVDDTIDVISAIIDGVPGLGNLTSLGIDIIHGLSYVVRYFYSKTEDEKVENCALALLYFGTSFIPVAGNSIPIIARQGLKSILKKTPQELMLIAKRAGLYKGTVILLSKQKWKYNLLLLLAKIVGDELSEFFVTISKKLYDVYKQISDVPYLKKVSDALINIINLVKELANDSNYAISLIKTRQI